MGAILWILIGLVLAGGAFAAYKVGQRKKEPKALPRPNKRTVLTLQVNDIVTHFTTDYLVEGKLTYNDEGDEWYEFMLTDGDDIVWLSVEEDDRLSVAMFREVEDLKFTSKPPEYIDYDGERYQLEEWGRAKVTRTGQTGTRQAGSVTYYDYEAPGGELLSVEQWGEGSFEVTKGQSMRPNEFEILPGDEVSDLDL